MSKFVFVGSSNINDNTEAVDMLDGRVAAKGEEIELSESELEVFQAAGFVFSKPGEVSAPSDEGAESEAPVGRFGSR